MNDCSYLTAKLSKGTIWDKDLDRFVFSQRQYLQMKTSQSSGYIEIQRAEVLASGLAGYSKALLEEGKYPLNPL